MEKNMKMKKMKGQTAEDRDKAREDRGEEDERTEEGRREGKTLNINKGKGGGLGVLVVAEGASWGASWGLPRDLLGPWRHPCGETHLGSL